MLEKITYVSGGNLVDIGCDVFQVNIPRRKDVIALGESIKERHIAHERRNGLEDVKIRYPEEQKMVSSLQSKTPIAATTLSRSGRG